jgi:hypothetical protein
VQRSSNEMRVSYLMLLLTNAAITGLNRLPKIDMDPSF